MASLPGAAPLLPARSSCRPSSPACSVGGERRGLLSFGGVSSGVLWAASDLHVAYDENRAVVEAMRPESDRDWLLLAGDVAETVADVEWALGLLSRRYARVVWAPGNHEL